VVWIWAAMTVLPSKIGKTRAINFRPLVLSAMKQLPSKFFFEKT
jgi:hypothetical protein